MTTADVSNRPSLQHIDSIADVVKARCGACGGQWEYARHEALRCPMCAAGFTLAHFASLPTVTYVDFDAVGGATRAR